MSIFQDRLIKKVETSLIGFDGSLDWYADARNHQNFVGQFLDSTGCGEPQFGIFGISCWIVSSEKSTKTKVKALREICKGKLIELVAGLKTASALDEHQTHLKENILKIGFAIEALSLVVPPTDSEFLYLLDCLLNNQKTNGSWDFITNSVAGNQGNILATAIVLRCLRKIPQTESNIQKIDKGITYLNENYSNQKNLYEQLFILNTIQILKENFSDTEFTVKEKFKKKIKNVVRDLYTEVRLNPTKFANPINVDYHQNTRTAYFRLPPSSLILLESLILISNQCLPFINAYIGKRIFNDLTENIGRPHFDRDITDHRASSGVYYYKFQTINLLLQKKTFNLFFLKKIYGWLACIFTFGANLYLNFLTFIIALPLGLIIYDTQSDLRKLAGSIIWGVGAKAAFDILKDINDLYKIKK